MRASATLAVLALSVPAAARSAPICADRPTRANATCTVPVGRVQVETALVDYAWLDTAGGQATTFVGGASAFKVGASPRVDLEILAVPFMRVDAPGSTSSGFGDTTLRLKARWTSDRSPVQVAAVPFVKLPTANHGLGNGKVEGGVALPVSLQVGRAVLTFGPELDWLADSDGSGRHLATAQLVNLAVPAARRWTVIGELWGSWNFDPAGTVRQASADVALAYAASDDLQLDAGINLGLARATADLQLVAGMAIRL